MQFVFPYELPRIKNRAAYERDATTPPDWRIACCYAGRGHRRQGVFAAGLGGALEVIGRLGGGAVEGYPEAAGSVSADSLYHGALRPTNGPGSTRCAGSAKNRWVVTRRVDASRG